MQFASERKHLKYDTQCDAPGVAFRAFAVTTFDVFSPECADILRWITDRLLSRYCLPQGLLLVRQVRERLSVAVM